MVASEDRPLRDRLARVAAYPLFLLLHGLRWRGVGNVPSCGPAILASNHQSYLDPVLIGLCVQRHVVFLAWRYFYDRPVVGRLMRLCGAVPVDVDAPGPAALRAALATLERGQVVAIFPEGGRTKDGLLCEPHTGVAALALRTGAPIVPVTIRGAFRAWPPGRMLPVPAPVAVHFGEPIAAAPRDARAGPGERDRRRDVAYEVMFRIADGFDALGRPDLADESRCKLSAFRRAPV